jgi:hypothetical protein
MMIILALQHIHMQRDPRIERKALQAMADHLCAQVADLLALETRVQVRDEVGAVGQVDDGARERLVERAVGAAEAGEAGAGRERGFEGCA